VWERERACVHIDRREQAGGVAAHVGAVDLPSPLPDQQPVDRETVVIGSKPEPGQIDGDAGGAVPARREAIRPGREEWEPKGGTASQGVEPSRQREVLGTAVAQDDAGHAEPREEDRGQLAGREHDRGLTAEAALFDADAEPGR
jgi:hypothetical protein